MVYMFCPNCGTKSFKVNYCPTCGADLTVTKQNVKKTYINGYQTPTIVAKSADKKIHKNVVLVDYLPLLIVFILVFIVVVGLLLFVLI